MMEIWKTENGPMKKRLQFSSGCWIRVTDPDQADRGWLEQVCGLDRKTLESPMDLQETPGASVTKDSARILPDVPASSPGSGSADYCFRVLCHERQGKLHSSGRSDPQFPGRGDHDSGADRGTDRGAEKEEYAARKNA